MEIGFNITLGQCRTCGSQGIEIYPLGERRSPQYCIKCLEVNRFNTWKDNQGKATMFKPMPKGINPGTVCRKQRCSVRITKGFRYCIDHAVGRYARAYEELRLKEQNEYHRKYRANNREAHNKYHREYTQRRRAESI